MLRFVAVPSNMVVSGDEKKIVALLDKLAESIPGLLKSLKILSLKYLEPVFCKRLRSPGIDSQPGGPVRQTYLSYRPTRLGIDSSAP
jgi:hypothetical protein